MKNWQKSKQIDIDDCVIIGFDKTFQKEQQQFIDASLDIIQKPILNIYEGTFQWNTLDGICYVINPTSSIQSIKGEQFGAASSFKGCFFFNGNMFIGYAKHISIQS